MTLTVEQLQTQHPETYHAVIALERDRVAAHLRAGDASGEHALARAAIASGADFESHSDQYLNAARARRDVALREIEGVEASEITGGAEVTPNEETGSDLHMSIADKVEKLLGLDQKKLAAKRAERAAIR